MFTIEKSIPIPATRKPNEVYPFQELEVGDSFFVPFTVSNPGSVRACASAYAKRHSVKLVCKKVEDGMRVWRTA